MARILVFSGSFKGKTVELPADRRVVLGRSKAADIRIPDRNMSRQQCAIWQGSSGYMVEDLESTNGTYLNGTRVKNAVLKDGDRLKFGDTEIEFRARERSDDSETKHELKALGAPEKSSGFEEARTEDELKIAPMDKRAPSAPPLAAQPEPITAGRQQSRPVGRMKGAAARPRGAELRPDRPSSLPGAGKQEKRGVVRRPRMRFCDECGISVPAADLESGAAKSWSGNLYCSKCARKLQGGGAALGDVWQAGLEEDD